MEAVGAVSERAAVGHRARGLQRRRRGLGPFLARPGRSRAYRWGEDGLAGICDDRERLCLALALWNGKDPFLKERLFGLTNGEGNHGEDVKELYYYLDATPTHSYLKMLYKYPQRAFPTRLVEENGRRGREKPEFELMDTGVFDDDRYFDVFVEYAKAEPDDILMRSRRTIAAPTRQRSTSCRSSGFATSGHGALMPTAPTCTPDEGRSSGSRASCSAAILSTPTANRPCCSATMTRTFGGCSG